MARRTRFLAKGVVRRLEESPREEVRKDLRRLRARRPVRHKVVAFSLMLPDHEWLTKTIAELTREFGDTRPSASQIVRTAIIDLRSRLEGKAPIQIRDYVVERISQS